MATDEPAREYAPCPFCKESVRADLMKCEACGRRLPVRARKPIKWVALIFPAIVATCLAVMLVPNYIRASARGPISSCESNCKNIGTALEMYSTDNKGRYPPRMALLTPDYLKVIPSCPGAHTDTYSSTYVSVSNPDGYTFYCQGNNHSGAGLTENFPEYNSNQGLILK